MPERATRLWRTSPTIQIAQALERAGAALERVEVEQRLGRVLVLAVPGVDHRGARPARDQRGGAGVRRADHDRGRVVGGQRLHRVLERLALVDARAGRLDADEVGAEALGGQLEARAGAGRGLVEEVDDRAPAQRGDLLDLAPGDLGEALGAAEDALDVVAREVVDRQQMAPHARSPPACFGDYHFVHPVDLLHPHVHPLAARGRQVLADVVGADRQLAMAAVGQHRKLHALGAPVVEQRVDAGPDRAPGVEHVVHEDDRRVLDGEVDVRGVHDRLGVGSRRARSSR